MEKIWIVTGHNELECRGIDRAFADRDAALRHAAAAYAHQCGVPEADMLAYVMEQAKAGGLYLFDGDEEFKRRFPGVGGCNGWIVVSHVDVVR